MSINPPPSPFWASVKQRGRTILPNPFQLRYSTSESSIVSKTHLNLPGHTRSFPEFFNDQCSPTSWLQVTKTQDPHCPLYTPPLLQYSFSHVIQISLIPVPATPILLQVTVAFQLVSPSASVCLVLPADATNGTSPRVAQALYPRQYGAALSLASAPSCHLPKWTLNSIAEA